MVKSYQQKLLAAVQTRDVPQDTGKQSTRVVCTRQLLRQRRLYFYTYQIGRVISPCFTRQLLLSSRFTVCTCPIRIVNRRCLHETPLGVEAIVRTCILTKSAQSTRIVCASMLLKLCRLTVYTYPIRLFNSRCSYKANLKVEAIVRLYLPSPPSSNATHCGLFGWKGGTVTIIQRGCIACSRHFGHQNVSSHIIFWGSLVFRSSGCTRLLFFFSRAQVNCEVKPKLKHTFSKWALPCPEPPISVSIDNQLIIIIRCVKVTTDQRCGTRGK